MDVLKSAGIRSDVIVMVGGAPVTQEYADAVGADGYAADASTAVRLAKDLIQKKRSAVDAMDFDHFTARLAPRYCNMRKATIYAGSNEIQRNIIAKATLGL